MPKGIKKIKFVGNTNEANNSNSRFSADRWVTVPANKKAFFCVKEWHKDTTEEQKKGSIYWIILDKERSKIVDRLRCMSNKYYSFKIPKHLCGYPYYVEASMTGKPDKGYTGLFLAGYCPALIVSSFWSKSRGGINWKNTDDNNHGLCYGDEIHFHADTEGINGTVVTVEVLNEMWNGNYKMRTLYNVTVIDGQINLKITNTSQWKPFIKFIQENEEFYVKIIQKDGTYLKDKNGNLDHGKYLNIKNVDHVTKPPKPPENQVALLIGNTDKNIKAIGQCKFTQIKINDGIDVDVFTEGKTKLKKGKATYDEIIEYIYFDMDKFAIRSDAKNVLNILASKLLNNKHSTVIIEGHADERGAGDYNLRLSQNRSEAVSNYLKQQNLEKTSFHPEGFGENYTIYKGSKLTEAQHQQNRRVKIRFSITDSDAQSLIYETIAPPQKSANVKNLDISVKEFETKACVAKHEKKIFLTAVGQAKNGNEKMHSYPVPNVKYPVYSNMPKFTLFPIQYIWPGANSPNKFNLDLHSCTYFSNKKITTTIIKVYPDIKWNLTFSLNLTNDLGVKWQNLDSKEHKDWQRKAGKMGAEKRWKQKDASFDFSLKATWDNDKKTDEFKYKYETKIKKLYDVFASIGALSEAITNKTKGCSPTGIPMTFAVKPPNLTFSANWYLQRPKEKTGEIGTYVKINLNAQPLIGLEVTIDLLGTAIFVGSSIVGAGPGVTQLYQRIQGKLKKGVKFGNDDVAFKANIDIYMDLVITQTINLNSEVEFNTKGNFKENGKVKVESNSKLKVELKVGIKIKGELSVVILTVTGYFEASASGNASVTFGSTVNYADDKGGLFYRPILGFDGLNAKYIVEISAGLAVKIVKDKKTVEDNKKYTLAKGDYPNVIPKFDVISQIEEVFGISANIPLIKNN